MKPLLTAILICLPVLCVGQGDQKALQAAMGSESLWFPLLGNSPDYKKLTEPEVLLIGDIRGAGISPVDHPEQTSWSYFVYMENPESGFNVSNELKEAFETFRGSRPPSEFFNKRILVRAKVRRDGSNNKHPKIIPGWIRDIRPDEAEWNLPWIANIPLLPSESERTKISVVASGEAIGAANSAKSMSGYANARQLFSILEAFHGDVKSGNIVEVNYSYSYMDEPNREIAKGEHVILVIHDCREYWCNQVGSQNQLLGFVVIPDTPYHRKETRELVERLPKAVKDLPLIKEMPDPLIMNDETKVKTLEQWKARRQEMIKILEDYEYGHMPPPPGNVKALMLTLPHRIMTGGRGGFGMSGPQESGGATQQADYRMLHLSFGPGEKLGFDLGIFTPVESTETHSTKKYPVLISLGFSAGENSLGPASVALARGYAVATIAYNQLGADAPNYRSTAFFPAYPDYDWNDFSAWAWGISRAVDYLVTDPVIDKDKIIVTGASRIGQAVLLAGAFDERIALSAPVAGGMAFRFSGKEMGGGLGQGIAEIVDQNTYWFGPRFAEFKGQTERLPCDQHWLVALTAPRLFIMCNSLADQWGRAYAAVQTYLAAKPVYSFLKADDSLGVSFRPGGHGMTAEDWATLLDFADQKLLKKAGNRRFDILPAADQLK